jgi:glycosyltransferase involved in cell wall biosynthesis
MTKSDSPQISVIMSVFNGAKYLREAIDSILVQTYRDFEFIIIDDGSTDNSKMIVSSYQDERIRLIENDKNMGVSASVNIAVEIARGYYVARMDCDDVSIPERFIKQLNWLDETGADICGGWIKLFGTSDNRTIAHAESDDAIKMELLFGSAFANPTVMMKTKLLRELKHDSEWDKAEEYDLWVRAAQAGWKMTNMPEVLLKYRLHASQISTASSVKQQELTQQIRHRYWNYVFEKHHFNNEWISDVLKLRELNKTYPNMDNVDAAFFALLEVSSGEARNVVLDHATRLYMRAASDCSDVVTRWGRINKKYGHDFAISTKLKLFLLRLLGVNANSRLFFRLKQIYFYIVRSI